MKNQEDSTKKTEQMADIMKDFVKKQSWQKNLLFAKAVSIYNSIKDTSIRQYSKALHVIENELYINVTSPLYANQLSFRSQKIVAFINKELRKKVIKKLRFQIGSVERDDQFFQEEVFDPIEKIKLDDKDNNTLNQVLSPVSDDEIKNNLNKLFASALKNRKRETE